MGKPPITAVVYATLAALLLLLLLRNSSPPSASSNNHHNRRLKLRSTFSFTPPSPSNSGRHGAPFDPLVADIEMRREDKEWEREHLGLHPAAPGEEKQPEWEDFMDAEDYLNDEDKFNITTRIVVLFPKIDVDPADGFLTVGELTEWNVKHAVEESLHRTKRDMELHDKNHDGFVSMEEYEPPSWAYHSADYNSSDNMGWWKGDHFNAADMDGDGLLNLTEFNDFLHPSDSDNPKLISWLHKEEIRERDKDRDGKLNFEEFFHGLFDSVRDYDEFHDSYPSEGALEASAKNLFKKLDIDQDSFLFEEELKPVLVNLHPSERHYAKQQAEHTLTEADTDKDGRLSLKEMIENPYVFYSHIFKDDEDDYDFHDEFR